MLRAHTGLMMNALVTAAIEEVNFLGNLWLGSVPLQRPDSRNLPDQQGQYLLRWSAASCESNRLSGPGAYTQAREILIVRSWGRLATLDKYLGSTEDCTDA